MKWSCWTASGVAEIVYTGPMNQRCLCFAELSVKVAVRIVAMDGRCSVQSSTAESSGSDAGGGRERRPGGATQRRGARAGELLLKPYFIVRFIVDVMYSTYAPRGELQIPRCILETVTSYNSKLANWCF